MRQRIGDQRDRDDNSARIDPAQHAGQVRRVASDAVPSGTHDQRERRGAGHLAHRYTSAALPSSRIRAGFCRHIVEWPIPATSGLVPDVDERGAMVQNATAVVADDSEQMESRPITVAAVPAGHQYVERITATSDLLLLPDPPVAGAAAGEWWPPAILHPAWIDRNRAVAQILHIHFGTES